MFGVFLSCLPGIYYFRSSTQRHTRARWNGERKDHHWYSCRFCSLHFTCAVVVRKGNERVFKWFIEPFCRESWRQSLVCFWSLKCLDLILLPTPLDDDVFPPAVESESLFYSFRESFEFLSNKFHHVVDGEQQVGMSKGSEAKNWEASKGKNQLVAGVLKRDFITQHNFNSSRLTSYKIGKSGHTFNDGSLRWDAAREAINIGCQIY